MDDWQEIVGFQILNYIFMPQLEVSLFLKIIVAS